jgi:hypothetical protein
MFPPCVSFLQQLDQRGLFTTHNSCTNDKTKVIVVLINIFLNATIWLCKTPLIFLYLRLFHVKRWLRRACYAVLAIGFIPPAVALITTAVYCAPRNTEDVDKPVCGNMSGLFNTIIGLFSVLTDVALFIIPLPIIKELNLPTRRKIGLGSVFLVGIM